MSKPHENTNTTGAIRKLNFPDGSWVSISNLDNILNDVANLKLTDARTIKKELLNRVKACNYVTTSAEDEYSVALFREYQRKFGETETVKDGNIIETKKRPAG